MPIGIRALSDRGRMFTPSSGNRSGFPEHQRFAWTAVALLLPVALLNYLDRQMLATMKSS
jgi:hypothetical protein